MALSISSKQRIYELGCYNTNDETANIDLSEPIFAHNYSYDNVAYLAKGGFAKCYSALETSSRGLRKVALKVFRKKYLIQSSAYEKVCNEIIIHRKLHHRNIIDLYNYFEDHNNVYMVLELCESKTLFTFVKNEKGGRLTEAIARSRLMQITDGVIYLHDVALVIHRDLKPANILIDAHNQLKIADFGLAKYSFDVSCESPNFCGTPNYLAPEVLIFNRHSEASDAWSIGCILYFMLFGMPPFETASVSETYDRIISCNYSIKGETISSHARGLICRLLEHRPSVRCKVNAIRCHKFLEIPTLMNMLDTGKGHKSLRFEFAQYVMDLNISKLNCDLDSLEIARDPSVILKYTLNGFLKVSTDPPLILQDVLMVDQWQDYRHRNAFGLLLNNGSLQILFDDNTTLVRTRPVRSSGFTYSLYLLTDTTFPLHEWNVPDELPCAHLRDKMDNMKRFSEGFDYSSITTTNDDSLEISKNPLIRVIVRQDCLVMLFARNFIEIDCMKSHYKVLIHSNSNGEIKLTLAIPKLRDLASCLHTSGKQLILSGNLGVQRLLNDLIWRLQYPTTEC